MTALHDAVPEQALKWVRAGRKVALATVIETWGSAPRPVGSQLAIGEEAEMVGSVSGGCVEGAVVAEALEAVEDGRCRVLEFGVSDDEAFAVGLACGGRIRVMVEPVGVGAGLPVEMLDDLVAARAARRPVALATDTQTWAHELVGTEGGVLSVLALPRFHADKSGFEEDWFLGIHNPPLAMVVVGAVHIAQPLMEMARLAGYDAVLVDPREAFASEARFPGARIIHDWPDAALAAIGLDARTAVVTLTHDPKLDDPAIEVALRSDVFYLGCLGSTRTHAKRLARLEEKGFSADEMGRIHAPVGADIGAKSPAEIAVSIMAEITERLRRPESRPGQARQGVAAE
ncbi:XdhC family protein [Algicella marina]|uniref:XdhC/CoxI family protein n=1 Tax=Algicella marina TaxID=2683284 RepID=A0A6P1STV7_9RHOB|nr:XdhC/CoxI family protein [Algicella marina]QHQ34124.1 XdhC/CoxI family protein [Algicella marina]